MKNKSFTSESDRFFGSCILNLCCCLWIAVRSTVNLKQDVVLPLSFLPKDLKSLVACKKHHLYLEKTATAEAEWM